MRLAMVTPLDPFTTGVADYSKDLLPYLAKGAQKDLALHVYSDTPCRPGRQWTWHSIEELEKEAPNYDLIIYQMGNSPAHDFMVPFLLRYPGLVVLHDLCLYHLYIRQAFSGQLAAYLRAFAFGHGVEGLSLARLCLQGKSTIEYPRFLLSEWLAARSVGVIVHSRHAAHTLGSRCHWANIVIAPMPIPLPQRLGRREARKSLSLPDDVYLLLVFGVLNESKDPLSIISAFQMLLKANVPALLVFIGRENSCFRLGPEIERRGLQSSVKHLGFVPDWNVLYQWFAAADVAISLRSLYWGETPSSTLRVLAAGTPVIVNNVGAFGELPDTVCIKIPSDTSEIAQELYCSLLDLWREQDRRRSMGEAARNYIKESHAPSITADAYWKAINSICRGCVR